MNKYESLASYLEQLLGNYYNIKYYNNKSVDWDKIIVDEMAHGAIKVVGGSNQSVRGIKSLVEELALTIMISEGTYTEKVDEITSAFESIDKQVLLLGEDYYQFIFNFHADMETYVFGGDKYYGVTYNFTLTSFDNVFLGEDQTISIKINNQNVALLGITGITYRTQTSFDGTVTYTGIQKNHISGINQDFVIDGICVKDDAARAYIKTNRLLKTDYIISYYDGEDTITDTFRLGAYTCVGVSGNLVKYQISFISKG